jgi:hypothetical protein
MCKRIFQLYIRVGCYGSAVSYSSFKDLSLGLLRPAKEQGVAAFSEENIASFHSVRQSKQGVLTQPSRWKQKVAQKSW